MPSSPLLWFGNSAKFLKSLVTIPASTSGTFSIQPAATTTSYSVTMPSAQASGSLTNDGSGNLSWTAAATASNNSYEITNLGISTSVASNALTINITQADGSTAPSSGTGAVYVALRPTTVTSGAYNRRSLTSALSLVVPSGATIGIADATLTPVYVYVIDFSSGTLELGVSRLLHDETKTYSTQSISSASDTNSQIFTTVGRSDVPIRLVGRLMINLTTAGTYNVGPTQVAVVSTAPFNPEPVRVIGSLTAKNIPNNAYEPIAANTPEVDTHNIYNSGTGAFLIPKTASYLISGNWTFDANPTGERQIAIFKNSSLLKVLGFATPSGSVSGSAWGTVAAKLSAGDSIQYYIFQTSGTTLSSPGGDEFRSFSITEVVSSY